MADKKIHMHRTDVWTSWKLSQEELNLISRAINDHRKPGNKMSLSFVIDPERAHDFENFTPKAVQDYYGDD